jgi:hypothetical protein
METYVITGELFKKRVVDLFVRSGLKEFPTKHRDQLIVLKSITLGLESGRQYTEAGINEHIKAWLTGAPALIGWDHITLRRRLVDAKLLSRTRDGSCYYLASDDSTGVAFEPEINHFNFLALVAAGKAENARRKAAYLQNQTHILKDLGKERD